MNPLDTLLRARNADGGWGYAPGRASRIEPTCWAILATARATEGALDADVLLRWPRQGAWLVDVAGTPVNYAFNALAGLVLAAVPQHVEAATRIGAALLDVRGLSFGPAAAIRQDNSLQAWPWMDGTFSWLEPTALATLLVKKLRGRLPSEAAAERIGVGEAVLRDRACGAGGWNYGGSNVYGQELFAYVPTTALGILALQDRDDPVLVRAVNWLQANALTEASAGALALARVALAIRGVDAPQVRQTLARATETASDRSLHALATALYASSETVGAYAAFRL